MAWTGGRGMNENRLAVLAIIGLGAVCFAYHAMNMSGNQDAVPEIQGEGQVMGMGVQAGMRFGEGTPLDCRPEVHFWTPSTNDSTGVVATAHRYPAIPGGNVSTVMHKGWSQFCKNSPANNDWRLNPPEVAVL